MYYNADVKKYKSSMLEHAVFILFYSILKLHHKQVVLVCIFMYREWGVCGLLSLAQCE